MLLACLGLLLAGYAPAQTFTNLHNFTGTSIDGASPRAGLILSSNTLYGTTFIGGSSGRGTVFALRTDGSGFTNLYSFTSGGFNSSSFITNGDGANPASVLILSGNTLYGTTQSGGIFADGTVFAVNTDGTGFTNLNNFTDGGSDAGLVISGKTLYGTTSFGGSAGDGTVFAINTDGTGFTNLHTFTLTAYEPTLSGFSGLAIYTNSDGANPYGELILSSNIIYGTTYHGGNAGLGSVFAVNTDGSGFTNLHYFTITHFGTNSDGSNPSTGLVLSGNTLYGTTYVGGSSEWGTLFAVNTDGTGFTNFHNFTDGGDGGQTLAGLIVSGNTLYGNTSVGGNPGNGAVFAIQSKGLSFRTLYNFTSYSGPLHNTNSDGGYPEARLILSGNTLYGTASRGGSSGQGTVFALSLPFPPSMGITTAGNKIILSWPTNVASFTLHSTTYLSSGSWSNVTSGISTVGTNYVFTNTISGNGWFFRLKQ